MSLNLDIQMRLYRSRLFLEEGQSDRALVVLEAIGTDQAEQQQELDYLLGWGYTLEKRWKEALRVLSPFSFSIESEEEQQNIINREQLVQCLLRLGEIAVNMAKYEDASRHYTKCLKALQSKKIHQPLAQIKARYGLAMTCSMRGLYVAAIQHYEQAIRLCLHVDDDEEIGNIYYGLSDTYRRSGDFINAKLAGEKTLALYVRSGNQHMEGVTHNLLGRISLQLGNFREASDHYTEAIAIATTHSGPKMVMVNCTALADVRLAEGRLEEARRYCLRALELTDRLKGKDEQLIGLTYLISGKVAHAEAQHTEGEQKHKLLEEAIKWFEQAKEQFSATQAYADVAELYGRWAQVLEELGQYDEALLCWKSGYEALSSANGQEWY